ncbi:hypothetical protein, partial [Helicobacter sp. MIT 14-3879]|uniref:hypothetical protein n=1 Tax=Helicobacter sp. MIT 14-3879 TaxID=2040649 RepID=UPI000E1E9971
KYTAYCFLGNHANSDHLYKYLFSTKSNNIIERLKQFAPEAQRIKKYFREYDFSKFWNDGNKTKAIDFIESLANYAAPPHTQDEDSKSHASNVLAANISDKHFKDFLHLLAINLLINNKKDISPMDFGMFYYCLREWADGLKYLEESICMSLSSQILPTFVFHDEEYERSLKEQFLLELEQNAHNFPHSEFMVYVPYSSSPNKAPNEMLLKVQNFHKQFQNILQQDSDEDLEKDFKEIEVKEDILKRAQLEEMELKESQLAQVQLKRSAFKTVKDGLDERLKIAAAKEMELREQRESLENKYKDSKIAGQKESYESQIAEVRAKENQYKEIRLNLEGQLQDAKNVLEDKLRQTKEILESKLKEIQAKEADVQAVRAKLNAKLANVKGDVNTRIKQAKDYLTQLRSLSVGLNKAIESCEEQMQATSKPNPVWANPLKFHASGLRKIQKNLPNMIRVFDAQIKQYEESTRKKLQG